MNKWILIVFLLLGSISGVVLYGALKRYHLWAEEVASLISEAWNIQSEMEVRAQQQEDYIRSITEDYMKMGAVASAMNKVSETPYENPGNTCYDHSKELQRELAKSGVLSFIAVTEDNDGNGLGDHAYVLIGVEANTGKFASIESRDYTPLREVRDTHLRVICR